MSGSAPGTSAAGAETPAVATLGPVSRATGSPLDDAPPAADPTALAAAIDAALPQTQCTRCGEPDCRRYAEAIAHQRAPINRCPPGGAEGIARLAAITGLEPLPLDPKHGAEGPLQLAVIDEAACIGCALCIKACPVDCIVGAAKHMHTVIEAQCTGCELCIPACPVDCISMVDVQPRDVPLTGWAAWSPTQAKAARQRYGARNARRAAAARARRQPPIKAVEGVEGAGAIEEQPVVARASNAAATLLPDRQHAAGAALPPPNDVDGPAGTDDPAHAAAAERKRAAIEEALRRARLRRMASPT